MRSPENRNAGLAPGVGSGSANLTGWKQSDTAISADLQAAIFTAIPTGRYWRVKVLAHSGEVMLLGKFESRLPALGAALLMSAQGGGAVLP